jgi:uncharacterized protein
MVVLGEDEWGLWLGATPATWFTKPDHDHPGGVPSHHFAADRPTVQLITRSAWWTLVHNERSRFPWYVDIVTPAEVDGDVVQMVDLDLDVLRDAEGRVALDDEDEFELHRRTLGYPERWIDQARATAARIHLAMEAHQEPFGRVADTWLATLAAREEWSTPPSRSPIAH